MGISDLFKSLSAFLLHNSFICLLMIMLWCDDTGGSGSTCNSRAKAGYSFEPSQEAGGICLGSGPKETTISSL